MLESFKTKPSSNLTSKIYSTFEILQEYNIEEKNKKNGKFRHAAGGVYYGTSRRYEKLNRY